MKFQQVL